MLNLNCTQQLNLPQLLQYYKTTYVKSKHSNRRSLGWESLHIIKQHMLNLNSFILPSIHKVSHYKTTYVKSKLSNDNNALRPILL